MSKEFFDAPLCKCGCGKEVGWDKRHKKWNQYLLGHGSRPKKKYIDYGDAPLCGCGCGKKVLFSKEYPKKWNRFIHNHKPKGKESTNYKNGKYAKERAMPAPRCQCGHCTQQTKWSMVRGGYNKYACGHGKKSKNWKPKPHDSEAPLCGCGCNKKVKWSRDEYQWRKYILGHGTRGKENPAHSEYMKKNNPMAGVKRPKEICDAIRERMLNGGAVHALSFQQIPSKPQIELYDLVKLIYKNAKIEYRVLNRFIDIAIPDKMIAIEYDGSYWHQDKEADILRQKELENIGWNFLRYMDYIPPLYELKKDLRNLNKIKRGKNEKETCN
jgi:hypothetical protein